MELKQRSKNGPYYVHFTGPEGERLRRSTGTSDYDQAQLKALEIMRETLVDGMPEEDRRKHGNLETLSGMLRQALHEKWGDQKSSREKRLLVGKIAREIGHWPRGAVTYTRLKDYLDNAETRNGEPLSPATKNRYTSCVHTACMLAHRRDNTYVVPTFHHWPENNVKERYLTPAEEQRILAWFDLHTAPGDRKRAYLRDLFVLLLDTGMRASEVLKEMGPEAIIVYPDGRKAVHLMHGNTKSGKGRVVPLTKRAELAMERMLASPVHRVWTTNNAGRAWRFVVGKLGLEDVTLHTLRHSCASRLVQRGVDLYQVSIWLGHSSMEVTRRYAHLAPETLKGALAVLEADPVSNVPSDSFRNTAPEVHPPASGTNVVAFSRRDK